MLDKERLDRKETVRSPRFRWSNLRDDHFASGLTIRHRSTITMKKSILIERNRMEMLNTSRNRWIVGGRRHSSVKQRLLSMEIAHWWRFDSIRFEKSRERETIFLLLFRNPRSMVKNSKKGRTFAAAKYNAKTRVESTSKPNPFDLHVNRLKHDVLGKKRSYERGGQPLKSRSRGIEKVRSRENKNFDILTFLEKTNVAERIQIGV